MENFSLTPVVDLCPGAELMTRTFDLIVLREVEVSLNLITVLGHDPFSNLTFARAFHPSESVYARNLKRS